MSTSAATPQAGVWTNAGAAAGRYRFHVARFLLALIETEGWVFVVHQRDVAEDAVEPAVDAEQQVEQAAGLILPGDQQEGAGDDDQQVED